MNSNKPSNTQRFSDRVTNYTNFRPSYPTAVIDWLVKQYRLSSKSNVADIGAGTGIFSQVLMRAGLSVTAVEPNDEMRHESDRQHLQNPLYSSQAGTAEATHLATESIDLIAAAQAFHWFDQIKTKAEFQRILRPNGVLALVWNKRDSASAFQAEYDRVLQTLPEYEKVKHSRVQDDDIATFFGGPFDVQSFPNSQDFDLAGFKGRVFSSSYTPAPDDSEYVAFNQLIEDLYKQFSVNDKISLTYQTQLYSGVMK